MDIIPLKTLYKWCEIARKILTQDDYNVSRVIARPYKIIDNKPTRISKDRKDYSMNPPHNILNKIQESGGKVIGIGKIEDIFSKSGITHAIHTGTNLEGLKLTLDAINNNLDLDKIKIADCGDSKNEFIFTNLVDTDMLYGHRNDPIGYGKALEEIDEYLKYIIESLKDDDVLIITADHGCDPTVEGTDHTREQVPILIFGQKIEPKDLGIINGFDYIAKSTNEYFFKK